jgi:hypothetical protein
VIVCFYTSFNSGQEPVYHSSAPFPSLPTYPKNGVAHVEYDDGLHQRPQHPTILHHLDTKLGCIVCRYLLISRHPRFDLASILRCLFAFKTALENKWRARARSRRYVLVRGKVTEAGKIEGDSDAKSGCLITAHGVEENVKVVDSKTRDVTPFRLSVDAPRAAIVTVISGVAYLL